MYLKDMWDLHTWEKVHRAAELQARLWSNATGTKPARLRFRTSFLALVHASGGSFDVPDDGHIILDSLQPPDPTDVHLAVGRQMHAEFSLKEQRRIGKTANFYLIYGPPRRRKTTLHLIQDNHEVHH